MAVTPIPAGHVQGIDNVEVEASATITASQTGTVVQGLTPWRHAALKITTTDINLPDATNEVDFYIQTSYDFGASWVDLENLHLSNADNNSTLDKIVVLHQAMSAAVARAVTNGTLTDNTKLDLPLGERLRIRVIFLNQTGSPSVTFSAYMSLR